jgi:hypothetical protein
MSGPTLGALKWYVIAAALRDATFTALDPSPCRYGVVPGAIAWDECECGALYVTILRTFLSDTFPEVQEAPVGIGSDAVWEVAEIVLQVLRCAPQPDAPAQLAPEANPMDDAARLMAQDSFNMLAAVQLELCTMKNSIPEDISDFLIMEATAVGPEGLCVGTEMHVMVALPRG